MAADLHRNSSVDWRVRVRGDYLSFNRRSLLYLLFFLPDPGICGKIVALIIVSVAASSQGGSSPGFTESELSQHTQFSNGQLLRDTAFIVRAPNRILMVKARVWAFHALTDEWVVALIAG